ncbi:MAG: hypothetical protein ACRCTO_21675 [Pseudomonas paracarnis]
MTTNGVLVSRELLEGIALNLSDDPAFYVDPMMADYALKLRALLDAKPAEVTGDDALALTVDHQQFIAGDHEDLIDNASDFQDRAYALGVARGIARCAMQPQGEPVAWMQPNQGGMCISNEVKQHSIKLGGAPASAVAGYSIPLYAEQPAPVAVVLPERRDFSPQSDSEWGWNACLDEVARLTATVRIPEPLVMTDGLHTYEYVTGHNAAIDKMLGAKSR